MTGRKKKLILIQLSLLITGLLIIFFTYVDRDRSPKEAIIPQEKQKKIKEQLSNNSETGDIFYNIEYSGFDLAGNRYIIKSAEAFNNKNNQEIVNMKLVEALFYFKNGTILKVISEKGLYNNETLDMIFETNVKANYENSELYAQKAEYSNQKSFLIISDNVKIIDTRGTMFADKLLFDIKKQTLNIASFNNDKVNANINLK
tara:strand:- start:5947 stop:6552 length:606 start_codon:yes stop_codon:yes gene_type:complete